MIPVTSEMKSGCPRLLIGRKHCPEAVQDGRLERQICAPDMDFTLGKDQFFYSSGPQDGIRHYIDY